MKKRRFVKKPDNIVHFIAGVLLFAASAGCPGAVWSEETAIRNVSSCSETLVFDDSPRNRVNFYVETYGLADPGTNDLVRRTYDVFTRVLSVADKRGNRLPHLRVVNSSGTPWAIALPDGFVVLSVRAVELCYQGVEKEVGDTRMAFVLGHELGHLSEDDFWHLETYMSLAGDPEQRGLKKILEETTNVLGAETHQKLAAVKSKEMKADDRGFLYSALAGYPVETLLGDGERGEDFFTYWVAQISHAQKDTSHPKPEERARFLMNRLERLLEKVHFYKFGVRLAHFGRYEDAIYFFREFQRVFPSREVYNNLGYCYLQLALRAMQPDVAYRYWLPMTFDPATLADQFNSRGEQAPKIDVAPLAGEFLREAAHYLEKSAEADRSYVPSRINLAAAYFYMGEIYKARAIVEEALRLTPKSLELMGLKALILYREDSLADMWPQAENILKNLAAISDAPLSVRYNWAVLLDERGRKAEARKVRNPLLENLRGVPKPFRVQLSHHVSFPAFLPPKIKETKPLYPLPIEPGIDLLEDEGAREELAQWKKTLFNWQKKRFSGHIYSKDRTVALLEIDDYVELVAICPESNITEDALTEKFGEPRLKTDVSGGALWTYGSHWSAWVKDGLVKEIWAAGF